MFLVVFRGDYSKVAAEGDYSKVAAEGDYPEVTAEGKCSKDALEGECSKVLAVGGSSKIPAEGGYSKKPSRWGQSKSNTEGDCSKVPAESDCPKIPAEVGTYSKTPARVSIRAVYTELLALMAMLCISEDADTAQVSNPGSMQIPWWGQQTEWRLAGGYQLCTMVRGAISSLPGWRTGC